MQIVSINYAQWVRQRPYVSYALIPRNTLAACGIKHLNGRYEEQVSFISWLV